MPEYSFPKADGDIFFASEANTNWYLSQSASANTIKHVTAITSFLRSQMDDLTADNSDVKTDVQYDSVNDQFVLAPDPDGTPTEDADFTGGSMDTDWTLSATDDGSATFDAANDEADLDISGVTNPSTAKVAFNGTDPDNGVFVAAIRNVSQATATGTIKFESMGIIMTYDPSDDSVSDNTSGASTTTLATANKYFRIQRSAAYAKTETSTDGSAWTTLNEVDDFNTAAGDTFVLNTKTGGNGNQDCSVFKLTIFDEVFVSSGTVTFADVVDTTNTIKNGFTSYTSTETGDSSIQAAVSADAGGAYTNISNNDAAQIGTPGSVFKVRFTLNAGSTISPALETYGASYTF